MVSDCGLRCKQSRMTYQLKVERKWNGVGLWTQMQREQEDALPKGEERA